VLGQREFAGLVDEVPGFARKLLTGMAKRLREADARSVQ
jgi:CRP-like cAMP-binding protein